MPPSPRKSTPVPPEHGLVGRMEDTLEFPREAGLLTFFGGYLGGKLPWGRERRVQLLAPALWHWHVNQVSIAPASITQGQGEGEK